MDSFHLNFNQNTDDQSVLNVSMIKSIVTLLKQTKFEYLKTIVGEDVVVKVYTVMMLFSAVCVLLFIKTIPGDIRFIQQFINSIIVGQFSNLVIPHINSVLPLPVCIKLIPVSFM